MSAVSKIEPGSNIVPLRATSWLPAVDNSADIELIKNTYAKGLHDNELQLFVSHANQMGLSIIKKQIYAIVRGSGEYRTMSIQVGIDGYRAITEANPEFAGYTEPEWCGEDGVWKEVWLAPTPPRAARIGIYRKGFPKPIWGIATYDEYVQTTFDKYTKTQKPNSMWTKMPANQLLKCAEAAAHRRATPGVLAGSEMFDDSQADAEVETVEAMGRTTTVSISGGDANEEWTKANRRLRAIAAEAKVSDRNLHLYAFSKGKTSLKDLGASELGGLANSIKNKPDAVVPFFADLERKHGRAMDEAFAARESAKDDDADQEDTVPEAEEISLEVEGEFVEMPDDPVEVDPATGEVIPPHVGRGNQQGLFIDLPEPAHRGHGDA